MSKKKSMSRRSFIGASAAGLSSVAFSSALMEMLLGSTGCKSGPGGAAGASTPLRPSRREWDSGPLKTEKRSMPTPTALIQKKVYSTAKYVAEAASLGGGGNARRNQPARSRVRISPFR